MILPEPEDVRSPNCHFCSRCIPDGPCEADCPTCWPYEKFGVKITKESAIKFQERMNAITRIERGGR